MTLLLAVLGCVSAPDPEPVGNQPSPPAPAPAPVAPPPPRDCPDGTTVTAGDTCVLPQQILDDVTLFADIDYLLSWTVFVGNDVDETVLTIEPGTTVRAESQGSLVIRRGAKLVADGRADAPIVFTSAQAEGERTMGDWPGVVLQGRAPVHCVRTGLAEDAPCERTGESATGWFGGDDPDDNSGTLRYVRFEFTGALQNPCCPSTAGLHLNGVGRGTVIDHVQVHRAAYDGVRAIGGTVDLRHVFVSGAGDDLLDFEYGWSGRAQYLLLQSLPDAPGDNGIEGENDVENNDRLPRAAPVFANVTAIGIPDALWSDIGLLVREGAVAEVWSSQFVDFERACVGLGSSATYEAGITDQELVVRHTHMDCAVLIDDVQPSPPMSADDVLDYLEDGAGNRLEAGSVTLVDGYRSRQRGGAVPDDPFFEDTDLIGAVDADADWTSGWTAFPVD